jgi:carboxypeptidase Taq
MMVAIDAALGWDERTQLPPAGGEYRAEQSTLLAGLIHQRWVDPKFGQQLEELAESRLAADLQNDASVVIRRLKRQRDKKIKLPQTLVEELARTAVLGQQAWQEARKNDAFPAFRPLLEKTIELKRQQAEALGYPQCPYDALLDEYEPEALTADLRPVLEGLREELVPLVAKIQASRRRPNTALLHRKFPVEVQDRFGREAAAKIGFDFTRGRLDVTTHPFCTTLGPHDCRITTRYDDTFFNSAFFGILHEAGHGLYEQGLPIENYGLPSGEAISLGIHESQSRLWENLVGRSRAFWTFYYPLAQQQFPAALGDVALDDFYFAINDVRPSLVRVEADEATYNLHI